MVFRVVFEWLGLGRAGLLYGRRGTVEGERHQPMFMLDSNSYL